MSDAPSGRQLVGWGGGQHTTIMLVMLTMLMVVLMTIVMYDVVSDDW